MPGERQVRQVRDPRREAGLIGHAEVRHEEGALTARGRAFSCGEEEDGMPKMVRKGDLPSKICAACGLPFAWRKKWARDWDAVKFCSERCRGEKGKAGAKGA